MQTLAGRYRGNVQAYELWNEANLAREWGYGRIDAGEFVELMLAGHQGVKAGDPEATTVGGALTPAGDVDIPDQQVQAVDDVRFLEQIYAYRDGVVRDAFDAWESTRVGSTMRPRRRSAASEVRAGMATAASTSSATPSTAPSWRRTAPATSPFG